MVEEKIAVLDPVEVLQRSAFRKRPALGSRVISGVVPSRARHFSTASLKRTALRPVRAQVRRINLPTGLAIAGREVVRILSINAELTAGWRLAYRSAARAINGRSRVHRLANRRPAP